MIVVVILLIAFLTLGWGWKRLSIVQRRELSAQLEENARTLLALSAILILPTLLLLPRPEPWSSWPVPGIALTLWAVFLMAYWASRVVPVEALRVPAGPYGPERTPFLFPAEREHGDGDVGKLFQWSFTPQGGQPEAMRLELALSSERYEEARAEARRKVGDWAHYAERDMPELHGLAARFSDLHRDRNWSTLEQASNILCFTQQCVDYRLDQETTPQPEWPRYPIETLMDEVGDCEDDVILTAAVLKRLGYDVALLYYPGHCALGVVGAHGLPGAYVVYEGKEYFYGETTAEGWLLGEAPEPYRGRQPDKVEEVKRVVTVQAHIQ